MEGEGPPQGHLAQFIGCEDPSRWLSPELPFIDRWGTQAKRGQGSYTRSTGSPAESRAEAGLGPGSLDS